LGLVSGPKIDLCRTPLRTELTFHCACGLHASDRYQLTPPHTPCPCPCGAPPSDRYQLTDLEVPLLTMTRKLDELLVPGVRFGDGGGDPCGVWRGPGWMSKPPWAFGEWEPG